MDTLLRKQDSLILMLGEQGRKQNQINQFLSSLNNLSHDASGKLSEQISAANVQLDFFQQSSRPNLIHVETIIKQSNNGSFLLRIILKNTGERDAKDIRFYNAFYKKINNKFSLIFDGREDSASLVATLPSNSPKEFSMYLSKEDVQELSTCYSYYKIDFIDPLYKSQHSKTFFYKRYIDNGDTLNIAPNNEEIRALQKHLKLATL